MRKLTPLIFCVVTATVLSACGNKGDLYINAGELNSLEMEEFQQVLDDSNEVPMAEPIEVDDTSVYVKPEKNRTVLPAP